MSIYIYPSSSSTGSVEVQHVNLIKDGVTYEDPEVFVGNTKVFPDIPWIPILTGIPANNFYNILSPFFSGIAPNTTISRRLVCTGAITFSLKPTYHPDNVQSVTLSSGAFIYLQNLNRGYSITDSNFACFGFGAQVPASIKIPAHIDILNWENGFTVYRQATTTTYNGVNQWPHYTMSTSGRFYLE